MIFKQSPSWKINPCRVFKDDYISYTRLKTFSQCPRRFELIYLFGYPEKSSKAAEKGSIIHKMFEIVGEKYLGHSVKDIANEYTGNSLLKFYDSAVDIIQPVNSFTRDEMIPFLANFIKICSSCDGFIILDNGKTVDTFIGDYPIKCIINRVDQNAGRRKLVSYKTGNKLYVSDFQLEFYGTVYSLYSQSEEILLEYNFLKDGSAKEWGINKTTFSRVEELIIREAQTIEKTTKFERKKTKLCNYCAVSHLCYS